MPTRDPHVELPSDAGRQPLDAARPRDASPLRDAEVPTDAKPPLTAMSTPPSGPAAGMSAGSAPDGGIVAAPAVKFEPAARGFTSPFMLQLTAAAPGAVVHYTLDGSLPSASSPTAAGPIAITSTSVVRALAVRGGVASEVFNHAYFALEQAVADTHSNLPVVLAQMPDGEAPSPFEQTYVPALLGVFEPTGGRTDLNGPAAHSSRIGIKIRGRSTRYQGKPSYSFELWGREQEDAPAPLLGMPADGDWVLYAPYDVDRSMMHNVFAYGLSNQISRYAPRTHYCELYLVGDGSKVTQAAYAGVYVLTERLSRGKDRVPIKKLHPQDVTDPARTGGYIVQVDMPDTLTDGFTTSGLSFVYVDPGADKIVAAQTQYLTGYIDAAMRAAKTADGIDPMSGRRYDELLDVASFIDHHILNLLLKNPDAFSLSSYFYKDRAGKLVAGPLWDLDLAMAAADPFGDRSKDPKGWGPGTSSDAFYRSFWGPLFTHPEFASAYWARWKELLASTFKAAALRGKVDDLEAELRDAEVRNRARWPESAPRNDDFHAEAEALRTWLEQRVAWIEANQGTLPPR